MTLMQYYVQFMIYYFIGLILVHCFIILQFEQLRGTYDTFTGLL